MLINLSTLSCLERRMQDELTIWIVITVPLNGLRGSNIWGTALTNQNSIQEEIKSKLKSGKACYRSMQNLLSSSLLSKNIKIKIEL